MKENSIRRAVREGRAALGTGLKEFASRGVPWIIEEAGFDYCAIDHEHGAFDMETIANLASWFQATNVTAIVRIHKSFAHLAYAVDNIYDTCSAFIARGVTINRPPRDGRMACIRTPDGISIELLQAGEALPPAEPWTSMANTGSW